MAEYEPYPTGANDPDDGKRLRRRTLGCFGLGGLGLLGICIPVVLLMGMVSDLASCDVNIGDPGDGKHSERVAVRVTPTTGLTDGAVVRVTSTAFGPNTIVGVAVCLQSADTQRKGVDACDEIQGARYATDPHRKLDATYPVPRVITVGGRAYDCAASPKRCLVVAADASNYDKSGGQPISFRAGLPAADLTAVTERPQSDRLPIGSQPSVEVAPVADDTELEVLASGFQPGEPLLIAYCTAKLAEDGLIDTCEPEDETGAIGAIGFRTITDGLPRADATGAFSTKLTARATVRPYAASAGEDDGSSTSTLANGLAKGEVRCTEATGGCTIVIAAAADTKRSAILPYAVTD